MRSERLNEHLARVNERSRKAYSRGKQLCDAALEFRWMNLTPGARRAFYVAPLFVTWIIGLSWDRSGETPAKRGFVLFLCVIVGTAFVHFLVGLFVAFFSQYEEVIQLIGFTLQHLVSLGYLVYSAYLSYMEYEGRSVKSPWIDGWYEVLERKLTA